METCVLSRCSCRTWQLTGAIGDSGDSYGNRSFHDLFYVIIVIMGQGNELTEFDTRVYVW